MKANRILAATDFSEASRAAMDAAFDLAEQNGARLYLLHVIASPLEAEPMIGEVSPPVPRHYKTVMQQLEDIAREHWDKIVHVEKVTLLGKPAKQIAAFARENDIDIIVVGAHSRKGVRIIIGSTAEALLRIAPCPVLVVKPKEAAASVRVAVPGLEC